MYDELEKIWKEACVAQLKYCSSMFHRVVKEKNENTVRTEDSNTRLEASTSRKRVQSISATLLSEMPEQYGLSIGSCLRFCKCDAAAT
jgi:hypothetical protein